MSWLAAVAFTTALHLALPKGFQPNSLAVGDFNGDGITDLAVAGLNAQLIVFLSDGHGGFRASPPAACGVGPSAIAVADMNGDGHLDMVIANHDTDHLTLLLGDGRGRFTARELHVHSNPHPHAVAAGDFDGDGKPDIVFDSWAENRLMFLYARDGWRGPGTPFDLGRKPYFTINAADLNGDGHADLVVTNEGEGTVSILLGDGHGHFRHAPGSPFAAGPAPFSAMVADVNGDHRPDVVVANYSGHITVTGKDGLTWIRNDGGGRFTPFPTRIFDASYSSRIAAANGVVALTDSGHNRVLIANGARDGLHAGTPVATMPQPHSVALADFNRDGRADLAVCSETTDEVWVFFGR